MIKKSSDKIEVRIVLLSVKNKSLRHFYLNVWLYR